MIFSSLEFVCVFLPAVFALYCLLPGVRCKNALLIAASLLFYAYGEPTYVMLMIFSASVNYLFARLAVSLRYQKLLLYLAVIFNLGLLIFFKYTSFVAETWNWVVGADIEPFEVELPIGISFFTFQALSYVADVCQGKIKAQKSFPKVLLYICFFPQLIAGPIIKYRDIEEALTKRRMDLRQISDGMRRFICGLGKKILIANTVGQAADAVFGAGYADINILAAWLGAASYMLQIYYDFSAYSDMAIGLGQMFGFQFRENFRYPYGATSVKEFWQRWHISLSSWFKEYLYIPLGGNRRGKIRTAANKFTVFFFTGLWHGANWTFVLWGLFHGFFSALEGWLPFFRKIPKPLAYVYTMLVVCIGFVMFRAEDVMQGIFLIRQMFVGMPLDNDSMSFVLGQLTPWFLAMALAGLIGMAPIRPLAQRIRDFDGNEAGRLTWRGMAFQAMLDVGAVLLLFWCIVRLSGHTYNPFIYFRF